MGNRATPMLATVEDAASLMVDHAFHLAMLALGVAAFFVAPTAVAIPIFLLMTGGAVATFVAIRRAVRLPTRTGNESLAGEIATVVAWENDSGLVRHKGELWRAEGPVALPPRTRVRILSAEGTVLRVQREGALL